MIPLGGIMQFLGCASVPVFRVVATNGRAFVPFDKFDTDTTAVLINIKGVPDPVIVMRDDEGEFSAVSGRCTHQGCIVRPSAQFLICPCHGSTYTRDGLVVRGPAQAPLTFIPVELSSNGVEVLLEGQ
jgi:cytochrome b6-f complex iron-sulfur subunit